MSSSERTEVLVVGAGPTGLTLGAALARLGIRTRIVDRSPQRTDKTKAIGVQAGVLEALGHFFGADLPARMVAAGHISHEAFLHVNRRPPVRLDLSSIPSRFNFLLLLPQSFTERFLEEECEKSGLHVERSTEVTGLTGANDRPAARCLATDANESIEADFVVGCDGAHSVVRHEVGIPFAGGAYEGNFVLGDVVLRWRWNYTSARAFLTENGIAGCFPLPGEPGFFRLILAGTKQSGSDLPPEISQQEFCQLVERLLPERLELEKFVWLTRFRLHHRLVSRFRSGRVFLAGDAAHIHSPAGGQGMNTGILDALNLANKLAAVLRSGAPDSLLDEYERQRLPVARRVVHGTDLAFEILTPKGGSISRRITLAIVPRLMAIPWIQRRVAKAISQVSVARREMADYRTAATASAAKKPAAGSPATGF
jgi:3-(3-hydroxy-phenyl)propionate hydroxylase